MRLSEMRVNNYDNNTTTYEGWMARPLNAETELVKIALTSFFENTFYESQEELIYRIKELIDNNNISADFLYRLAIFWRNYWLRSINQFFMAYAIVLRAHENIPNKRKELKNALKKFLWRPDELSELYAATTFILSLYTDIRPSKESNKLRYIPRMLLRVTKELIEEWFFNDYKLVKYEKRLRRRKKKDKVTFTLADITRLSHIWGEYGKLLTSKKLPSLEDKEFETAESILNNKEIDVDYLADFVANKMGDKAILMYLRTLINRGLSTEFLANVIKNRSFKGIFPYEFIRTIWFLREEWLLDNNLISVLEEKAVYSLWEIPIFNKYNKVAILIDVSWSMTAPLGKNSKMTRLDLAAFYWALVKKANKWDIVAWADYPVKVNVYPDSWLLDMIEKIRNTRVWWATNIQDAIDFVRDYEAAIVFTDGQFWDSISDTGNLEEVFVFNLASYKNSIALKENIIEVNGFNDIMFKIGSDVINIWNLMDQIYSIEI